MNPLCLFTIISLFLCWPSLLESFISAPHKFLTYTKKFLFNGYDIIEIFLEFSSRPFIWNKKDKEPIDWEKIFKQFQGEIETIISNKISDTNYNYIDEVEKF